AARKKHCRAAREIHRARKLFAGPSSLCGMVTCFIGSSSPLAKNDVRKSQRDFGHTKIAFSKCSGRCVRESSSHKSVTSQVLTPIELPTGRTRTTAPAAVK